MSKKCLLTNNGGKKNFNLAASSENCRYCEQYDTVIKKLKEICLLVGLFIFWGKEELLETCCTHCSLT